MPEAWTSFDESLRSRACLRNQHEDCPHFSGLGGGINPRRLRPEFGAGLCPCTCHTACPVTITTRRMTVPIKTWYDSCTCPGADQARQSMDDAGVNPDFGARWEESQNRSRAGKEAFTAAKARDSITGNPLPAARLLGHQLATMGKEIHKLTKLFTQGH
jgi:hypothetical protein